MVIMNSGLKIREISARPMGPMTWAPRPVQGGAPTPSYVPERPEKRGNGVRRPGVLVAGSLREAQDVEQLAGHLAVDRGVLEQAPVVAGRQLAGAQGDQVVERRTLTEPLPARVRQCLLFRYQGYRYREIARAQGVSIATVKKQITQGYQRLRPILGPFVELFGVFLVSILLR